MQAELKHKLMRKKAEILEIMEIFKKENPNPHCELNYSNAYTLLVAVVLSAQTTDKGVNRATENLFKIADTPQKMIELGEDGLIAFIRTIGLFNNKAKNIISLSKDLLERFGGVVPDKREDLESLAGVGRKTANVVLNVWFNKPALAVDTHVMRISHRLDFSQGKTPLAIELDLLKKLPEEFVINANHWFVLFGRYICKAQKPECLLCPIATYCYSKDKKLK